MNFGTGGLLIKYKYCGGYTGLRHPPLTSQFTCHFPASELAMPIRCRFDEFGHNISVSFVISEMNRRILIPYNKLYIISIFYTECVYLCYSKRTRE